MAWITRVLTLLLRAALSLGALLLVLLALYVSLGRELMPLLAEYQAEVQKQAQAAIGMPLRIGRLEGSWRDFGPLLVAHDVELGEGAERIYLQTLRIKPELLVGLLERRLEIQRIEVEGLRLSVRQSAEGAWAVAGLPAPSAQSTTSAEAVLSNLLGISQLLLLNSQVTLQPLNEQPISLTYVEFELRNGRKQRLDGRLNLPDGMPVSFSLRGTLNPADWRNSPAQLYLSLPQSDWSKRLPPDLLPQWSIKQFMAGGEFWAALDGGQLQRAVARLNAPEIQAAASGRELAQVQDLTVTAFLDRQAQGYNLRLESLAFSLGQTRFGPAQLALQQRQADANAASVWKVQADRLDLAPLAYLANALVPDVPALNEWLGGLKPQGQLSNIQLTYDPHLNAADRLQFAANLESVGVSPYNDVPGLENVSGAISGDLQKGALRLDAENFVLNLAGIFPQPWHYFKAGALLSWTLDEQAFTLRSPYIRLEGEEGRIAGDLKIAIPLAADQDSYMDLRVGLTEGDAAFTAKYLPSPTANFSTDLADWLKTAIVSGSIEQGLFQFQGSLSAAAPANSSTLSLYFKLHGLELAYQPGWPALREAAGEVFVGDNGVRVEVSSGQILESKVAQVLASVPPASDGQVPRLNVSANLQSSVKDGLAILQTAPLGTAATFAGWKGEGALLGKLSLDIPLGGRAAPLVVVDFAADGAQLSMPSPALQLSQITAAFRYNSATGLSAPSIRARAFNQAVSGKIVAEGVRGTTRTRIEANGKISLKDLTDWLGVDAKLLPVAGTLPYSLKVLLDQHSQLQVDSTLQGVSIDLPAPFGKTAEQTRASQLRMPLGAKEPSYWAKYADLASLALAMPSTRLDTARAELVLGGQAATLPTAAGFWLRGSVAQLDVSAWKALFERHSAQGPAFNLAWLRPVDLQVGHFQGFGLDAENLGINLQRVGPAWQVGLSSAVVDGLVTVPDQTGVPLVLNLKRLSLPEPAHTDEEALAGPDPLAGIDPASLPALDVTIAQVLLGGAPLGGSSFKLRPVTAGVEFSELNLNLKGLLVTGNAGWTGRLGATNSWYKGRLQGADIGAVLQAWNFAPSVSSERFKMDTDLRWPGSPAYISLPRLSGTLDGSMHNGSSTEVQGGGTKALRAFGLLNLSAIGRRLRLDFSDLFGAGMAYDRIGFVLAATNGVFVTTQPLDVKGPSVKLQLDGTLDMVTQQIDAKLYVTLPVSNTVVLGALAVGAPVVAGAIFAVDKLADKMFGVSTSSLTRVQYQVKGPMDNPNINFFKR